MLQLVGITAMFVASKYEETNVPCVQDFMNISKHFYTGNDVLQMVCIIIDALSWNPENTVFAIMQDNSLFIAGELDAQSLAI